MSSESWAVAAPQTLTISGVTAVAVRSLGGRVEVGVDPDAAAVTVHVVEVGKKPLQVHRDGSRLRIGYEKSRVEEFFGRIRALGDAERSVLRLTVPVGTSVDIGTVDAAVDVTGTAGTVVKTVTGSARVSGTSGSLYVRSVSGDVAVDGHAGDVSAQVVSGSLALSGALGRVTVKSVSGAVSVTADGTVPMVTTKSVSGDVAVRLPAGTPVSLSSKGLTNQVVLDGQPLRAAAGSHAIEHSEPPEGKAVAYLTFSATSSRVIVSRD